VQTTASQLEVVIIEGHLLPIMCQSASQHGLTIGGEVVHALIRRGNQVELVRIKLLPDQVSQFACVQCTSMLLVVGTITLGLHR